MTSTNSCQSSFFVCLFYGTWRIISHSNFHSLAKFISSYHFILYSIYVKCTIILWRAIVKHNCSVVVKHIDFVYHNCWRAHFRQHRQKIAVRVTKKNNYWLIFFSDHILFHLLFSANFIPSKVNYTSSSDIIAKPDKWHIVHNYDTSWQLLFYSPKGGGALRRFVAVQ